MIKHRFLVAVFASLALSGWSQETVIVESYTDGENSDGFSQVEGTWHESVAKSEAEGLTATMSRYNDADSRPGTARFTPNLPSAGKYEVFITYPPSGNASNIKYRVHTADGDHFERLTQFGREMGHRPAANQWTSIGVFNFEAGQNGYVEVSDPLTGERPLSSEPNARIYADAVRFVKVADSVPVTTLRPDEAPAADTTAVAAAPAEPAAPLTDTTTAQTMAPLPGEAVEALPSLPGAAAPAADVAALPGLPATTPTPSAGAGLPALPTDTATAPAGLPSLPQASPAAPGLPTLPPQEVAAANTGLPSLPQATAPDPAGALPSLPGGTPATATPAPADALPGLPPADQAGALPSLPQAAAPTPAPTAAAPNLPSLAPVTPTPVHTLPSPSDTPAPAVATYALPSYTPLAAPTPAPGSGLSLPTPIASGTPAATAAATPSSEGFSITQYNPSQLDWMYDFGAAQSQARATGKKLLVFFTAEHNRVAQAYETQMFTDPSVRQALGSYVLVKADFSRNTRLAYSLGVFGAGVIAVVDQEGRVTARVVQMPQSGAELLTQLSTDKAIRATPPPNPQFTPAAAAAQPADAGAAPAGGFAALAGEALPPAAGSAALGMPGPTDPAGAAAMPALPGTPAASGPAGAPALTATPAAATATPAAETTPASGAASDALPELPTLPM